MTNDISQRALLRGVGAVAVGAGALALFPSVAAVAPMTKVLMYAKAAGAWHDAVPVGSAAIRQLVDGEGSAVDADPSATRNLVRYEAVVWLTTSGDIRGPNGEITLGSYVNSGGSYVGVRSDANLWNWYGCCVGAYFAVHPVQRQTTLIVEDRMNESTAQLPATWRRFDEPYEQPRRVVRVLMSLDESSHVSADHPITWCHDVGSGRAWYTGLGHSTESHSDTLFTRIPLGDIRVALRAVTDRPTHANQPVVLTDTKDLRRTEHARTDAKAGDEARRGWGRGPARPVDRGRPGRLDRTTGSSGDR